MANPVLFQSPRLSLAGADILVREALLQAEAAGVRVAISATDDAGQLICSARMDGAPGVSTEISARKALTAAQLKVETYRLQQLVDQHHPSYLAATSLCPIAGGVPITMEGRTIGALGVSGADEGSDRRIAEEAVRKFMSQLGDDR
ncbi:heme-binding protein [Sphingobium sp. H33]|uniref:Heme-binding protein n=1 Tax=Sphingobium nicotianae TaxID=2782607 RepID=A0A9X1D9X2_9SPHN|nr:heme-binding protein [Sphingobium nicotianae]